MEGPWHVRLLLLLVDAILPSCSPDITTLAFHSNFDPISRWSLFIFTIMLVMLLYRNSFEVNDLARFGFVVDGWN
ncbi:hypothetical protein E1A91_D01G009200v1 [Gossypium mustelinum]|uniref:Uncharacterized protein n=1 Tax=Gossypium mustelinum TaxID=34275 RepID=A0A5D2W1C4_GOSMU|nr:hypothetical protein E1A91_D01G009200v1 [Gossypium mustelinum]